MMDRRAMLAGAGVLALAGCSRAEDGAQSTSPQTATQAAEPLTLDFSELENRFGGRLGFSIALGDRRAAWRGDERFVYCSTFKMYLAAATLIRVQEGQERLDRTIPVTRADIISHAPVTEPAVGSSLTIEQLMKGTVEVSDNPAANMLIREMGGLDALRAFYRGIGDETTRVDRLEPEMNRLDGDKDTIQPAQSVRNIERLILSDASPLDLASKRLLLDWMIASPTGQGRLKAGAPSDWTVAHKTGTGGYGPVNDIGVLYPTSGEPVVVAAYYHGDARSTDEQREAAIAEATRLALAALGHG